jgi:hypothetical protein
MKKYLVAFPIAGEPRGEICSLAEKVASLSNIKPPHWTFPPHLIFRQPLSGIDETDLINALSSGVPKMRRSRARLHALYAFGKEHIVLPAQATLGASEILVAVNAILSQLSGYQHDAYDPENTLYVTVAENMRGEFDRTWLSIQKIAFEPIEIPLLTIVLLRKLSEGGTWEQKATFAIPP